MIQDKITPLKLKHEINIMVVEDNLLNQKLAGFMIADWGFNYDTASNGKVAIENLHSANYDLILMDLHMPEMDGFETTEYIRKTLKLDVPIIAMTANLMEEEKEKCLSYDMTTIISKPINEAELYSIITKLLFSSAAKSEETVVNDKAYSNEVVNLDYLVELSKGNTHFVKEMITTFLAENPKEIATLEKEISSKNYEGIKQTAHLMLSSIPFIGLDKLIGNELYEIEKLAIDEAGPEKIEKLFTKVKETCAKARQELKAVPAPTLQ